MSSREVVAMGVPRELERENARRCSLSMQAASNAVRLGFEMLRLTARCCGEDVRKNLCGYCVQRLAGRLATSECGEQQYRHEHALSSTKVIAEPASFGRS